MVGVTGTNGKTTVASIAVPTMFKKAGYKVGLLSTVKIMVDDKNEFDATHTTPDPLVYQSLFEGQMNDEGVEFCFMEVSSHGIHQSTE